MHAGDRFHHSLGLGRSEAMAGRLDHFCILVEDIDDVMRARNLAVARDVPRRDDLIRHLASDSISTYINDVELLNAPSTHSWRRGAGLPILIATGAIFKLVDREPSIRQLYEIAELGKPPDEPTRAPEFLRLLVSADQPRIAGDGLDFRDEVMHQIFDPGDPVPKRRLAFSTPAVTVVAA